MGFASLLDGTEIEVTTSIFPTFTVKLADQLADSSPSFIVEFLRPRVRVTRNGTELVRSEPAGAPEDAPPYFLLAALAALLVTIALFGFLS